MNKVADNFVSSNGIALSDIFLAYVIEYKK